MSSKRFWIIAFFIAAASLWLRAGFSLTAMPVYKHDDLLFVRLGHFLAAGQWLGPFDNLTLAKGMFYPLFIAAAFWMSVPLKIAEQLFYLFACGLTVGLVRRSAGNFFSLVLFAFLAFNPVLWNYGLARVLRQGVYLSVALLVLTLLVFLAFPPSEPTRNWFRNLVVGVSLGLATTCYWLTREEGSWLIPASAVVLAAAALGILAPRWASPADPDTSSRRLRWKAIAVPLLIALVTFIAADFSVAALNYRYYGIFETNEFRAKNFLRAYGALERIHQDRWRYLVTIPESSWQQAYSVSPAARELEPSLEGPTRQLWLQITCSYGSIQPCDDVQTGYDMWEIRDAVANAGHYKSGADAMRFYGELADQIDAACAAGKISCLPPRATMQPPFRVEYLKLAWKFVKPVALLTFRMVEGPVVPVPSVGPDDAIAIFADTMDDVYLPETPTYVVRGWVASSAGTPAIRVESRVHESAETSVASGPAPDVERVYPALKSVRFELKTNCPAANCDLVFEEPGAAPTRLPLDSVLHVGAFPAAGQTPALMGYVESASGTDAFTMRDRRRDLQTKLANHIASAYAYLFPKLGFFAALGLLLATLFRRRFPLPLPLLALGLGSAAAVATYIALMSFIKATADMNVIIVVYLSPASPFVITFTLIGLYVWVLAFRKPRESVRRHGQSAVRTLHHIALP